MNTTYKHRDTQYQTFYKKYTSKPDLPDHSLTKGNSDVCGHPCNDGSNYMCGSIVYPNIKTPPQFAVYHIVETI